MKYLEESVNNLNERAKNESKREASILRGIGLRAAMLYLTLIPLNTCAHFGLGVTSSAVSRTIKPEYQKESQAWRDYSLNEISNTFSLNGGRLFIPLEFIPSVRKYLELSKKTPRHMMDLPEKEKENQN